jgi:hypothetical protein
MPEVSQLKTASCGPGAMKQILLIRSYDRSSRSSQESVRTATGDCSSVAKVMDDLAE